MKSFIKIIFLTLVMIMLASRLVMAVGEYVQLPKTDADRQTFLNNVTDTFTTIGKSENEKKQIIKERQAVRREERLRNERRHHDIQTKKQMKQQQKIIMEKVNAVNQARYSRKDKKR